jgi:LmbE family N-acetylglucosaminyl deacetylase
MAELTRESRGDRRAAVVVAHPDDEILWAGGTILARPDWSWFIATLCRGGDAERAGRFGRVLEQLRAQGAMADVDDGPDQRALDHEDVKAVIAGLLPDATYDVILTHGPRGEYTRHRRHEEVCRAMVALWLDGRIRTRVLWMFAFEDAGGAHLPQAGNEVPIQESLREDIWREKYRLVTEVYGFSADSWEARTTPRREAFRAFDNARAAADWVKEQQQGLYE